MSLAENSEKIIDQELEVSDYSSALPIRHNIEIRGDVRQPGEFTYKKEADIFHYLNLAGGAISDPKACDIVVIRQYGEQKRSLIFKLDQEDFHPIIRQGDVIIITELGQAKKPSKQLNKPSVNLPEPRKIIRPKANDYEDSLPSRGQSLKQAINSYIQFPQFKRLVNQIATHQAATGTKSIAVLSYNSAEGKSFFCSALSLAYARYLHSQVLIIDSNRDITNRSPALAVVRGDYSTLVPVQERHTDQAYIDISSVSEIESDYHENSDFYFSPYIDSIKSNYDLILVDTVASSSVANDAVDPMIIASQVDGVIIINSPTSLDKKAIEKFSKDLKKIVVRK